MPVVLKTEYLDPFIKKEEWEGIAPQVRAAHSLLEQKSGLGKEFLGWLHLPRDYHQAELQRICRAAKKIQQQSEILIVIGIGGSYLGARSAIEFLHSPWYNLKRKDTPAIYFAGNSLSPDALCELLEICKDKDVSLNVISKSGTTTEPAIAFRVLKQMLIERYGKEQAAQRIYCTTDISRGTLREEARREGYETFVIPDDVGGRFSVLTAVGLLPIAVSGADIREILRGAGEAMTAYQEEDFQRNDCCRYAALRNILYRKGKQVELFCSYEPAFTRMNEWLRQLFGESEGKDHKGLFPASAIFSTDLHSLGQFIQDGTRSLFETVIDFQQSREDIAFVEDPCSGDGLNFLAGQQMSWVNRMALKGTAAAHVEGGVPVVLLEAQDRSAFEYGWLVYFFEKACALSGYLLGVNPFDQPGVEQYKTNMFALLGKPGYEEQRRRLGE